MFILVTLSAPNEANNMRTNSKILCQLIINHWFIIIVHFLSSNFVIIGKPKDGSWAEDSFAPCSGNLPLLMGTDMYVRMLIEAA